LYNDFKPYDAFCTTLAKTLKTTAHLLKNQEDQKIMADRMTRRMFELEKETFAMK